MVYHRILNIVPCALELEKEMAPTPVFMPGKSHGPRSLVGYNPWGRKESDTTERLLCVLVFHMTLFSSSEVPQIFII